MTCLCNQIASIVMYPKILRNELLHPDTISTRNALVNMHYTAMWFTVHVAQRVGIMSHRKRAAMFLYKNGA